MAKKEATPAPSYAGKLNEWNDKKLEIATLIQEQHILQDEIAAGMGLEAGDTQAVTYLSIGYVLSGVTRTNQDGQEVKSCTIRSQEINEEI